jgi:hypothetical protein
LTAAVYQHLASLPLAVSEVVTTPLWPAPLGWALLAYLDILVTFVGFGVWFWGLRCGLVLSGVYLAVGRHRE